MRYICIFGVLVCTACLVSVQPVQKHDYTKLIHLSLLFYEAQRSGPLPKDNRITWRSDSALSDSGSNGEDLTGGYYDASDYVKFSFTMAFSTTLLSWGVIAYKQAYEVAGEYKNVLEAIKWASDYFIKCHVSPNEFYGQVGDFDLDHQFWGRPEELNMSRPAYKIDVNHPGTELASEASAALAATSILFREIDPSYSKLCLNHSEQLYNFANDYRGLYNDAIPGAKKYYESADYSDDLTWAAIWLYKATNNVYYRQQALDLYERFRLTERPNDFFFNKKVAGVQLLLGQMTKRNDFIEAVRSFCDFSVNNQKRTPKGLIYIEKFGTLSHAANIAFICLQAGELFDSETEYVRFARQQLHYMLGDTGTSYVIGYGKKYPLKPHHAASSCPNLPTPCSWDNFHSKDPNPQILYGALVSGPDENDYYDDNRDEYLYNEVGLDYNAGFQSLLAGVLQHDINKTTVFVT